PTMTVLERRLPVTGSAPQTRHPVRARRWRSLKPHLLRTFRYLRSAYSLDLRSLALFRIGLALVLIGDLIARACDLTAFYTDWGILPRAALLDKFALGERFSIHLMSGQFLFQAALFLIAGLFAVMLLFGIRTRFATIASWFMLVSVQMRNPVILQGGDVYLRLLAFIAIFLPLGAVYSVDAALDTAPEEETNTRGHVYFSATGVALMAQIAMLYIFAVMLKTAPEWRVNHTAVFYALSIQQMSTPIGRFLLHFPRLLPWLTRGTLVHEGAIPFLILVPIFAGPARLLAAILIVVLHIMLGLSIRLGHFPYIACMAALPLLPTWFWKRVARKLLPWTTETANQGAGVSIFYDAGCSFCSKAVRIVRTFLVIPDITLMPAQEFPVTELEMQQQKSWIVAGADGQRWYRWQAFAELVALSPFFSWLAPLLRLEPFTKLGERLYEIIERNRTRWSGLTEWIRPRRLKVEPSPAITIVGILFVIYVSFWNLSSVVAKPFQPGGDTLGLTLAIDQRWDMFAPNPLTYDGWYVIEGKLRDGTPVNVLHPEQRLSYERPASIADQYKDERWRKYMMNLSLSSYVDYRLYYGRYLCRSWNTGRWPRDSWALMSFDIYFMGRQNSISDPNRSYSKDLLWHHECFK
ncbi:MAG TPA: DCC1-like thiol-disulfide oxidoreductase family protein, partial [Terriglobales bacterium]|nr:DCC1-like thiol-disulfide oxidoreductase family protein [Terriglobales bacterium]